MSRESNQRGRPPAMRVRDIAHAVDALLTLMQTGSEDAFAADTAAFTSACWRFIVMGEAAYNVGGPIEEAYPDVPWGQMKGMRSFVAHVYWKVDLRRLYQTIEEDLPPLVNIVPSVILLADELEADTERAE